MNLGFLIQASANVISDDGNTIDATAQVMRPAERWRLT